MIVNITIIIKTAGQSNSFKRRSPSPLYDAPTREKTAWHGQVQIQFFFFYYLSDNIYLTNPKKKIIFCFRISSRFLHEVAKHHHLMKIACYKEQDNTTKPHVRI